MNEIHEVEIIIQPDGQLKVEIQGVKGKGCLEITKEMEELLGNDIIERNFTDEYNQQSDTLSDNDWLHQGD